MDPLRNYSQIMLKGILFFLLLCFNAADVGGLPSNLYLNHPLPSRWLRKIFPSTPQPPVASPQPQNSAPTAKSPSPSSSSSSFFPPHLTSPAKRNPQRNLFVQSLQLSAASSPSPPLAAADPVVKQLCNNTDHSDVCISSVIPYPVVKQLCNNTDHSDVCISSVIPFLSARGKTSIDAVIMLKMLIKALSIQAEMALAVASKHSTEPNNAHETSMAIMDCKEMYSDMLDGLQTATDAIMNKDTATVNSMLSGVISDAVTCEDGFEGHKSPLSDVDDKLRVMGSNCLAIASLLQW